MFPLHLRRKSQSTQQREMDTLWSELTFGNSHRGRETSDRVMAAGWRLRDERSEVSTHASNQVRFQLHARLQDMELWIGEFTRKAEEVTGQVERVRSYLGRLQRALTAIPPILGVDYEIFKIREARIGIDLIVDAPHSAVTSEVTLLLGEERRLQTLHKEGEECLRLLRKMGYCLGKQLDDRRQALAIDTAALNLNPHSSSVVEVKVEDTNNANKTLPRVPVSRDPFHHLENEVDWANLSGKQCSAAEKVLKDGDKFNLGVESVLASSCERIQSAICATNTAFDCRLGGLKRVKGQMEEEHHEISINIRNMEECLDKVKKALVEKEASISCARSRLHLRGQRPNLELVKDQVQKGLELEVASLQDSVVLLEAQLEATGRGLRTLLANQLRLEGEINVKMISIGIDETGVLPLRKTISVQLY